MISKREEFGQELRALRRRNLRGITLADAAKHIDCSIALMSAIERGQRSPPSNAKLRKLLSFYGEDAEAERILRMAGMATDSIEFSLNTADKKTADVLFSLARRSESGELKEGDPVLERIAKILDVTEEGDNGFGSTGEQKDKTTDRK